MTQEEKHTLLVDLCARLPYGIKCTTKLACYNDVYTVQGVYEDNVFIDCPVYEEGDDVWMVESIIPYLRPISSMMEEEREELFQIWKLDKENGSESVTKLLKEIFYKAINENYILKLATSFENWIDVMEWLNKKHFDYRGLIPMGLALEALDGMYVIE